MTETVNPQQKLRPTSLDVARAASVSQSTVSLVFNNVSGSRVSAATRERIFKVASELGYRPDRVASTLRKGYSDEIAMIAVEDPTESTVIAESMVLAQAHSRELGFSLGIYLFQNLYAEAHHRAFASIVSRRPVGIIGFADSITLEDWRLAQKMGVQACVLQGFEPAEFAPTLIVPLKQSFYIAGNHLAERGHKHIACAWPRTQRPIEQLGNGYMLDGLQSAMDKVGGTIMELSMNLDHDDAGAMVDRLLSSPKHPSAIVGSRDKYCFFLLKALSLRGIRVPQDIALVGIDNSPFCELSAPTLTSVGFDVKTSIVHAIDAIHTMLQRVEVNPELLVFPPPQLYIRESS